MSKQRNVEITLSKNSIRKNRKLADKKEKDKWNERKVILEKLKTMGDYEADLQTGLIFYVE